MAFPIARTSGRARINQNSQHFFTDYYEPVKGYFPPPAGPGFGYALDPKKALKRTEL